MTTDTSGGAGNLAGGNGGTNGDGGGAATPYVLPEWAAPLPQEDKEWLAKSGQKEIGDIVKSQRHLEKFHGANAAGRGVVLPKDDTDAEGWNKVWAKLGRPEAPEGYGLDKAGLDPEAAGYFAKAMHELGVPARQATGLAAKYQEFAQQLVQKGEEAFATQAKQQLEALQREWGPGFEERQAVARLAVRQFLGAAKLGPDGSPAADDPVAAQLNGIERALGTKAMYELFYRIGSGLGEGKLAMGAAGQGGGAASAPDAALAELDRMKRDPAVREKWLAGDKEVATKMNELYERAYTRA